ncbi:MAG: heme b synthase [Spirochaetes bacterium]|nr:heme b synthase [Spirochaetota bacterium]
MKNVPRLIFWELTKRCNLSCLHCRAEAEAQESDDLVYDEIIRIIDDIAGSYTPILILTGGEPLYRHDVFDIATYASAKGLTVALATNGTLITADTAERIRSAGIGRVSVSLDGADAAMHDSFRGIPGCFEEALRGIGFLKEAGVEFQINTTVTRRNVDSLERIVDLATRLGARALHLFMLVPVGCGVEIAESDMIHKERYEEVLNWFYDVSKRVTMELKATCAPHYYRIIRQRAAREGRQITFESDGMSAITRGCLAGTGVCFISHRGDVQPCGYLPLVAGNVTENPFREIWENSGIFASLRDLSGLQGKCGHCEYRAFCAGCRARAFYETGNHLAEEPYCVYVPKRAGG